jgi:tetratricopeptide (TPR) repeat protein
MRIVAPVVTLLILAATLTAQDSAAEAFARGKAAFERLDFKEARRALEAALEVEEAPLDLARKAEAQSLLASLAESRRDTAEAIRRRAAAVGAWEKAKGKMAPALIRPLLDQARALRRGKKSREALAVLERALTIQDGHEEADPVLTRSIIFELARVAEGQGRRPLALGSYQRYLASLEKSVGENASELAYPLARIANLLGGLGRHEEALAVQRRWIALLEQVRRKDDPTICRGLERTSAWALTLGRHDEALRDVERWLKILRSVTADHPEISRAERRAARIERARGEPAAALKRLDLALLMIHKVRGTASLAAAGAQKERAAVLRELGRHDEAASAIADALSILEKKRSSQDIEVLDAVLEGARIDLARGQAGAAEAALRRILRTWEKLAGQEHPVLVEPLRLLARSLAGRAAKSDEAAKLNARADRIEKKAAGQPASKDAN